MKLKLEKVFILLVWSALQACSTTPPMKVALTEMGTSSRSEYGAYNIKYMRSITVTGVSQEETIGSISVDTDALSITEFLKRYNLNQQDLPDTMNIRLIDDKTKIYRRFLCGGTQCPTATDVINIKSAIENQGIYIGKIADAELELKATSLLKIALDKKTDATGKNKLLSAYKQFFPNNTTIAEATVEDYVTKFDQASLALKEIIKTTRKVLEDNKESIKKPGIVVTNWKFDSTLNAEGGMPGVGASLSKNKDSYGYAIIGNPVILSLHLGNDAPSILKTKLDAASVKPWICDSLFCRNKLYMTVFQVRASYLSYAESLESVVAANIDLKVDELITTLQPLVTGAVDLTVLSKLKLNVAAEFSKYSMSSNQGFIDATGSSTDKFDYSGNMTTLEEMYNKTIPIINSRVNLTNLTDKIKLTSN